MVSKVSVILPTYNEHGNIKELSLNLIQKLKQAKYLPEIIIVDDNSPDGTGTLAAQLAKKNKYVKAILRKERGLASAIRRGINESSGTIIVVMDTDFSHPPKFVPVLLKHLENADGVFASRYIKGGSMASDTLQFHLSKLFNHVIKSFLAITVLDSTSGFFAIRKSALNNLNMNNVFTGYGDYCFKMLYAFKSKQLKIIETPFDYMPRRYGSSKTSLAKSGIKYAIEALRLRFRI